MDCCGLTLDELVLLLFFKHSFLLYKEFVLSCKELKKSQKSIKDLNHNYMQIIKYFKQSLCIIILEHSKTLMFNIYLTNFGQKKIQK
jgi:hypothetical protein